MKLCDVCTDTQGVRTCIITESMTDHSARDQRESSPRISDIDLCQACINAMREGRREARHAASHVKDHYTEP